jgi:hypothetical protein
MLKSNTSIGTNNNIHIVIKKERISHPLFFDVVSTESEKIESRKGEGGMIAPKQSFRPNPFKQSFQNAG